MPENTLVIERLTRVEEKLDAFFIRATEATNRTSDHEGRIRSLEHGSSKMLGIGAILSLIVGAAGTSAFELFSKGH
jgi:hypothetical protein